MKPPELPSLPSRELVQLFPFAILLEGSGRIVATGPSLRKLLGREVAGLQLSDVVEVRRPVGFECGPEALARLAGGGRLIVGGVRGSSCVLRGQFAALEDGLHFLLATSPWLQNIAQLGELGLKLPDFAAHDSLHESLIALQSVRTALDDARRLASELESRGDELSLAVTRAEDAGRAKMAFLAVMSHEIRTPMNGIRSMLDVLDRTPLDAEQRECVDVLRNSSDSLLTLVNDILDLSKIEAGRIELERITFDLRELSALTVRMFAQSASDRGIALRVEFDDSLPQLVVGDPTRLRQVFSNLISNALKFTERGSVTIALSSRTTRPGTTRFDALVTDTGCGVPEAALERLFESFSQADSSTTRTHGGTGLGLAICRRLARLMGGDVELAHTSSSGSTFRFSFELAQLDVDSPAPALPKPATDAPRSLEGLSVLVAEDNPVNRLIAVRLLAKLGVRCDVVENGAEAVELVLTRNYDAVLLDLHMPVCDGREALRRIREAERLSAQPAIPILAFTADVICSRDAECRGGGFDGWITKPVGIGELHRALAASTARERDLGRRT